MKNLFKQILSILIIFGLSPIVFAAPAVMKAEVLRPVVNDKNPTALKLEGEISITKGNPKINISLRDSDVVQVLRMFADKAGLNIVFHESVKGNVTLDLVNVPLNEAFKLVMQITDLTYYVDNKTLVVTSAEASKDLNLTKQEMVALPVKYIDAAIIAEFLNKNIFSINKPGLSNSEIAITNPNMNEILIFGTDNDVKMAQKIIAKFDTKPVSTTYKVNHTTPKEMANLVCSVLVPKEGQSGSSSSSNSSSSNSSSSNSSSRNSNSSSSKATGFASNSGSSSSGSSSSSKGSSGSISPLALGGGIIACEYNNKISTDKLSSLNARNMAVAYFPQKGTVSIIGGSIQQLETIKEFIKQNDKKQPQAYLELSVIELNETGSKQFQNQWQVWSQFFSATFDGTKTATNPIYPTFFQGDGYNVVDPSDPSKIKYAISKYTGSPMVTWAINYLIENKKGRVLANPRIMITNGTTSTIDLTSDYVKSVKSEVLSNGGGLAGAVQKTYEIGDDEGMKIEMIPFISPDGYITLNINPEYATIKERVTSTSASPTGEKEIVATLLQRRNLTLNNIRIKDGETLIIGGMMREDEQKTINKIPVLGDVPVIGMFFRSTSTEKSKQELIIMITPKIIQDSEDIAAKTPDL